MFRLLIFAILFYCFNLTPIPETESLDWRTKGAVLPVPNMGPCASTVVINALDAISAAHQIKTGKLVQLSQQQIYDCGKLICPCEGSALNVTNVYESIFSEGHLFQIDSESSYPFTGECTKKCNFKESGSVTNLLGYAYSPNKSEESYLANLIKVGPVTVGIEANFAFELYTGGILDDSNCKGDILNHNLLLVGYGTENGVNYWIARNSWGNNWGENGYIRIIRDKNMCGIGNAFVQPYVLK